ncbi:response regulator [Rhodoferax sp.]|uniref:response regulator n=1 Tax=Rhodoferax sp. TaxID=50421 RepID=UPI00274F25C5|nr:response regulator [Rhodoferax sp.]
MSEKLGRVLCVDDEPSILRSLQWLLKKEFDVKIATSGHEALSMLRQNDFDVIISDQRMPGMMGSEFLREARKISPRSMRILLTGYSDLQAILRSVNDGEVFRFVSKPWSIKELPRLIADAATVAKHQSVEPASPEVDDGHELDTGAESILLIDDDPMMGRLISEALGPDVKIAHATTLADAVAAFEKHDVGIVLADTRVANQDTTTMLKVLKEEHPDIVTVVYTATTDAVDVVTLINQGQIYRFIPKPVRMVMLKQAMMGAALKRRQLRHNPNAARRHMVERVADEDRAVMFEAIKQSSAVAVASASVHLLQRIGGSFTRLFGRG